MTDSEAKAKKLLKEAESKGKGTGSILSGIFGGSKSDEASELYIKAANLFKIAKKWNEAGNCFVKSAEIQFARGDSKHEAASNYADAANCFRKSNPQFSVDCLEKTAEIYTDMGRFTMAAKHHSSIAELYENEYPDLEKSLEHYQKAADYFSGEEAKSSANKCLMKVAQYAAKLEQYKKAIDIYEGIGISNIDSSLLKYSVKDYFFRALLCHLCVDLLNAQYLGIYFQILIPDFKHAIDRYEELCPAFSDTRECKLAKELIRCLEEHNADELTEAVKNYDKISRLDQWHTALLVKIKRFCGETEGEDDLK